MRIFFPNGASEYPPRTGADVHIYQLTRGLVDLGHEIFTLGDDSNPFTTTRPKTRRGVVGMLRSADVVYCRVTDTPNPATRLTSPPFSLALPRATPVVWELNTSISKTALGSRRRTADEIDRDVGELQRNARGVAAGICVTADLERQARSVLGIQNLTTIPNASDPDAFRPDLEPPVGWPDEASTVNVAFAAAGVDSHHDTELVAALATEIDARRLPVKIHVFGVAGDRLSATDSPAIVAHGSIPYLDMPAYLAGCDVGLALYNERVDFGSPLKLFDYLASGCIPVCSEASSMRDVLDGHDAGFIGEWTPDTLADVINGLIISPERRRAMQKAGRALILDRYNWSSVARQTEVVLEQSLAGTSRAR